MTTRLVSHWISGHPVIHEWSTTAGEQRVVSADEAEAEIARMRARIESLRGLCKTAVGWLHDADRTEDAETLHALIGDMEPPL